MRVRVLAFGVLKDWLGAAGSTVEVPEGATIAQLLARLGEERPACAALGCIAVSVNAEFAAPAQVLRAGDEVGLLPPVSGGCPAQGEERCAREEFSQANGTR